MKKRPILFSAPMVLALLNGTKTETRRIVKPDVADRIDPVFFDGMWQWASLESRRTCPYGMRGDRLWVRETFQIDAPRDGTWHHTQWYGCKGSLVAEIPERFQHPRFCNYRADWLHGDIRWRPGIHMPHWASRITLVIKEVRVERLQNISEVDAIAEGITHSTLNDPRVEYRWLWDSINGPDSWDANPWVWVVSFLNIDHIERANAVAYHGDIDGDFDY